MTRSVLIGLLLFAGSFSVSVTEAQETRAGRRPSIIDQMRARRASGETPGSATDTVGEITGDERFVRGARDASDFVGADAREGGFVGGQSAADGEIRSAIEDARDLVREATDPAINRMRTPSQLESGMYAPRLRLGFTPTTAPAPAMEKAMMQRLSESPTIHSTAPLEVSMAGRTATLHGTVASEHEKRLAGLMLLFEPGISKVENELMVSTPKSKPQPDSEPKSAPVESPGQKERSPSQG